MIEGDRYVLYTLEEDKFIIEKLVDRLYLVEELEQCDSLVNVLRERDSFRSVIEDGQQEQLDTYEELLRIGELKEKELTSTLDEVNKKARRRNRVLTALIVIGSLVTAGLLLFAIIK
jgi:hypothetical protein